MFVGRARFRLDLMARTLTQSKNHFSASIQLSRDTPAMEALKEQPYPSTPLDSSVFEEFSDEYTIPAGEHAPIVPRNSNLTLANLVAKGRYDVAERVRNELLEMNLEIHLDGIYEQAAIAALQESGSENRVTAFADWFSLIPNAQDTKPRSFHHIRQLLFNSRGTDLALIMRFGLICAAKGYARKVGLQVVAFVVRFADPSVAARFLSEFEKAVTQYTRKFYPNKTRDALKSIRGIAIRTHCLAGRVDEAAKMLHSYRARKLSVSHFTETFLLQKLEQNMDQLNIRLLGLHDQRSTFPQGHSARDTRTAPRLTITEASSNAPLATKLRHLKNALLSPLYPPDSHSIVDFIEDYQSTGRRQGLLMLRNKALQHSHKSASLWLMAEMLYHRRQREYSLIVRTFATHFHLVGVPQDEIYCRLDRSRDLRRRKLKPREAPSNLISSQHSKTEKIWPSPFHTALVWQAMVLLSQGVEPLEHLYSQLLHHAGTSKTNNSTTQSHDSSLLSHTHLLSTVPPPIQAIDGAHFTPFIRAFDHRCGPSRAALVLSDMLKLGILPGVYHYTVLAGALARAGDVAKTLTILDLMESSNRDYEPETPIPASPHLPAPNIVTYTNLLRGFVEGRCLDGALAVEARIKKNLDYAPGTNPQTDRALALLRSFQQEKSA